MSNRHTYCLSTFCGIRKRQKSCRNAFWGSGFELTNFGSKRTTNLTEGPTAHTRQALLEARDWGLNLPPPHAPSGNSCRRQRAHASANSARARSRAIPSSAVVRCGGQCSGPWAKTHSGPG